MIRGLTRLAAALARGGHISRFEPEGSLVNSTESTPKYLRRITYVTDSALFCVVLVVLSWLAIARGPDATWDLRNYHLYNPFALLSRGAGHDLFPAQQHGFINPLLDLPSFWLRNWFNRHPARLATLLCVPQAIAITFAYAISLELIPTIAFRRLLAAIAAFVGASAVSNDATLATSMSEALPADFTLVGLWLLLRATARPSGHLLRVCVAGLSFGLAAGLKLTEATYPVAAFITLASTYHQRPLSAAIFVMGVMLGAGITGGAWWLCLFVHYGNPVFPFFNDIFRSPAYDPVRLSDNRYIPHGLRAALLFPLAWATHLQHLTTEVDNRETRYAIAAVALTLIVVFRACCSSFRLTRVEKLCLLFIVIAFAIWETQFSIIRYLAPIEFIVAAPVLILAIGFARLGAGSLGALAMMTIVASFCYSTSIGFSWEHAPPFEPAVTVSFPTIPDDALVLILDDSPLSFVVPYANPVARFAGVNNNFIRLGASDHLSKKVEATVRSYPGPLYGLEQVDLAPGQRLGQADESLAYYGLARRDDCRPVPTNLTIHHLRLCALEPAAR